MLMFVLYKIYLAKTARDASSVFWMVFMSGF